MICGCRQILMADGALAQSILQIHHQQFLSINEKNDPHLGGYICSTKKHNTNVRGEWFTITQWLDFDSPILSFVIRVRLFHH